jgi:hypothetical protein
MPTGTQGMAQIASATVNAAAPAVNKPVKGLP